MYIVSVVWLILSSEVVCPLKVALQWQLRQAGARIASGKLVSESVREWAV